MGNHVRRGRREQKRRREAAVARMASYSWEDSRAKRTGKRNEKQWRKWTAAEVERLGG